MTSSSPRPDSPGGWDRWDWLALTAVMLLGALLRVPTLGRWSVWLDEAFTLHDAVMMVDPPPGAQWPYGSYPLNYVLEGYAIRWWGHGEVAVRLLPCIAGILCIGALYAGVRRHGGRWCAVVAATLLALSAWHLYWSQNARHYSLMLLFTVVGAFAGFRAVGAGQWRWAAVAAVGFALAMLTHPTAVFAVGGFGAFLVWRYAGAVRRLPGRGSILVGGVAALLAVVLAFWLYPVFRTTVAIRSGGNLPYFVGSLAQYLEIPLLLAALGGLVPAWRADPAWAVFLGASVLVPLAGLAALGLFMDLSALYAFVVLPGACALAAQAVVGFARPPLGTRVAGLVILAVVLGHELGESFLYLRYRYGDRPRWREAAAFLKRNAIEPRDVLSTGAPALAYHLGFAPLDLVKPELMTWLLPPTRDAFLEQPRPAWFVVKRDRLAASDADGRLREWLAAHAVIVATFPAWTSVRDRTIYVYRADPALDTRSLTRHTAAAAGW